jgi:hypothetical protein
MVNSDFGHMNWQTSSQANVGEQNMHENATLAKF